MDTKQVLLVPCAALGMERAGGWTASDDYVPY